MPTYRNLTSTRTIMGRLDHNKDLLEELTSVCEAEGVKLATVTALGAVRKARIGFYNQQTREYEFVELEEPLEILSLVGNVSLRDGRPMVHAHITLGTEAGTAYGGHLAPGTVVFACEFVLRVLEGAEFVRQYDGDTGLPLWRKDER